MSLADQYFSRVDQGINVWRLQINAAKHIVIARETLHFKNKGSKAVDKLVLCQPADLAPNRAFYEVRIETNRNLFKDDMA